MSTAERKSTDGYRVFNEDWGITYFVIPQDKGAMCVICQTTVAMQKEYNFKRHYKTTHASMYDSLKGQVRIDKLEMLKKSVNNKKCIPKVQNG